MIRLLLLFLLFRTVHGEDVVSAEPENINQERRDKHIANLRTSHRRVIEDMADKEWHVSHLKEFSRRSECETDTFEDKVRKYRRALKNDGALVEYVQADPLPFKESDLLNSKVCSAPKHYTDLIDAKFTTQKDMDYATDENDTKTSVPQKTLNYTKETKEPITEEVNSATTVKAKATLTTEDKVENKTIEEKSRRAGEYVFSTIEYYDEVSDFDDDLCPNAVEVINLEIDQLRNYDIECENTLQWRSLD